MIARNLKWWQALILIPYIAWEFIKSIFKKGESK